MGELKTLNIEGLKTLHTTEDVYKYLRIYDLLPSIEDGNKRRLIGEVIEAYAENKIEQFKRNILGDTILNLMQEDPHQWSMRPCATCRTISTIIDKPFGCYEYQRQTGE
jgi:hypothetical protein